MAGAGAVVPVGAGLPVAGPPAGAVSAALPGAAALAVAAGPAAAPPPGAGAPGPAGAPTVGRGGLRGDAPPHQRDGQAQGNFKLSGGRCQPRDHRVLIFGCSAAHCIGRFRRHHAVACFMHHSSSCFRLPSRLPDGPIGIHGPRGNPDEDAHDSEIDGTGGSRTPEDSLRGRLAPALPVDFAFSVRGRLAPALLVKTACPEDVGSSAASGVKPPVS